MTSLPEPEVNPLIPNGIENFVPKCVVCTKQVPPKRATSRSKDTCSPECHKVLRAYRKYLTNSRYCPACYHPSSPEERKDFILWRKHRGDRAAKPGRPRKDEAVRILKMFVLGFDSNDKIQMAEAADLATKIIGGKDESEHDQQGKV